MKKKKVYIDWLKAASIRAVKTIAQTAIACLSVSSMISEVDFLTVLSTSALSGVLSMLTSVKGLPELKESEE